MAKDWNPWFDQLARDNSAIVTRYDGYRVATYKEGPFLYAAAVSDHGKKLFWRKYSGEQARANNIKKLERLGNVLLSDEERKRRDALIRSREELSQYSPGTILYCSWGYEQTNVQWYKVMNRTGKVIYIQEVGIIKTPSSLGSGTCVPDTTVLVGALIKKQHTKRGLNMPYAPLRIWDGNPKSYSEYA